MKRRIGYCDLCGRRAYLYKGSIFCNQCNQKRRDEFDKGRNQLVKEISMDRCANCGATENLTLDHITPLSKGGAIFGLHNIQVLCVSCNSAKGAD